MPTAQVPTPARRRLDYLRYSQTAGMLPGTTIPSAAAAAAADRVGLSQNRVGLSPAAEPLRGRLLDETKALTQLPSFTPSFTAAEEQRLHGWLRALHVIALACREQLREQLRAPQPHPPPPQPLHAHESARRAEEPAANDERTEAREEAAAAEAAEEDGGWLHEDTPGEATLEDFMGDLVTELLGPAPEVLAAGTAKAALEEKEEEEEDLPGQEEEEDPEAALRRAEALEKEANTPPAAGQLALQLLRKSEVLLLSGCPSITHAVLDILSEVLPALAQWPRAALPAAYPLWPPLLALLDGDDRSVAAHAMRAFGLAVSCYGTELSTRVQSQAIEHLIDALIRYTAVPAAVVNDLALLASLDARGLRDGLVEAVKVSLLKDPVFFANLEKESGLLAAGNIPAIGRAVRRSAELHAKHIAGNGDPFELGSARPLDLGHWAAHKLESMTNHRLTHGEAVAVGLALDLICARELGLFGQAETERSLNLLVALGFKIYAPEMHLEGGAPMLAGLEEFREHLGGQLTLVLPTAIGKSTQVHEMASAVVRKAADELKARDQQPCVARS
jgi:hypothetical protein